MAGWVVTSLRPWHTKGRFRRSQLQWRALHRLYAFDAVAISQVFGRGPKRKRFLRNRRFITERSGIGSSPGSSSTSLAKPRMVVVHGATRVRRRLGITASRDKSRDRKSDE